jgi:hypothetical protein
LVHFSPFWYVAPSKIWQLWLTPEVHESGDVDDGVRHGEQDEDAGQDVEEEEEGGHEDAQERQADVPVKLLGYHLR